MKSPGEVPQAAGGEAAEVNLIRLHCSKERGPEIDNYQKKEEIVITHDADFQGLPNEVKSEQVMPQRRRGHSLW